MTYDEAKFDHPRLLGYAQAAARTASGVPHSVASSHQRHDSGLIFKKTRWSRTTIGLDAWILLVDPEEGQAVYHRLELISLGLQAWEHGRMLLISASGELLTGSYSQYHSMPDHRFGKDLPQGAVSDIKDLRPASRVDVIGFDRLNRSTYRERRPQRGEQWRRELGISWRIRVPHAGMETSLALKRLKELGQCVHELTINM